MAALLPIRERILGPEHRDTLTTRADLVFWTNQATPQAQTTQVSRSECAGPTSPTQLA